MALSWVWLFLIVIGFVIALCKLIFFQDYELFKKMAEGVFDTAENAVMKIGLPLAGTMTFFLGLLNIAERAGAVGFLSRVISPFFSTLFPEVPKNHPATGHMVMNFSANLLGLDNAATPFGLKAMESLQDLNPNKDTATNAQIMFLVLHTSGLTLIPISIMAYRNGVGATNPTDIFIPCILGTLVTTLAAILVVGVKQKLKMQLGFIVRLSAIVFCLLAFCFFVGTMSKEMKQTFAIVFGNVLLMTIIVAILLGGVWKKVNLFDAFVEGAKGGLETVFKIIPYLAGMLVAISIFRTSGAFDYIMDGISYVLNAVGINTDFVKALPTAIMKPFSGSGARGLMIDTMKAEGPQSFPGYLACIFQGSADTTLYIVALYFGSVGIKKVRYSIWAGMIADLIGVIAAIIIARLTFPY
jgi:spore maturation protein SpmA/spore maturation protein SpmB